MLCRRLSGSAPLFSLNASAAFDRFSASVSVADLSGTPPTIVVRLPILPCPRFPSSPRALPPNNVPNRFTRVAPAENGPSCTPRSSPPATFSLAVANSPNSAPAVWGTGISSACSSTGLSVPPNTPPKPRKAVGRWLRLWLRRCVDAGGARGRAAVPVVGVVGTVERSTRFVGGGGGGGSPTSRALGCPWNDGVVGDAVAGAAS